MIRVIGILGGMGPRATVMFEQLLLDRLPGNDQQIPAIVTINDGSIPDRSAFLLGQGPDPLPAMQRNLQLLERLGADIICIPCNTACAPQLFQRLQPTGSQIINLPEVVLASMRQRGIRSAFLAATAGTIAAGSYQEICARNGIACIVPTAPLQREITAVIRAVKRGDMAAARLLSRRVAAHIEATDCQAVILGCTELPSVQADLVPAGRVAIDSLSVLADSCVTYTKVRPTRRSSYGNRPIHA
jgi:aspartate racemase